jgi:murein L,D-transpeptidase YafK
MQATRLPIDVKAMVKILATILFLLLYQGVAFSEQKADFVLVTKSESRLYLIRKGETFASFRASFGSDPKGHKRQQGDGRTPEGRYVLDYKNSGSRYHRSIHISYPNAKDREAARNRGVDPGGDIMIHGQRNGWEWLSPIAQLFDWTNGCIALSNPDMDTVWEAVDAGTPIEIKP